MIDELRQAVELAAQQSEQEQAAIAARIREMIEANRRWDALLADPDGLSLLEEMAEEAYRPSASGWRSSPPSRPSGPRAPAAAWCERVQSHAA